MLVCTGIILGFQTGHGEQAGTREAGEEKKTKKIKHMTVEELETELKSSENAFRDYFLRSRKENPGFSLKDITDPQMLEVLDKINTIKRHIKIKKQ